MGSEKGDEVSGEKADLIPGDKGSSIEKVQRGGQSFFPQETRA